ncbi:hypothetical protein Ahy_A05g022938 [Arachis hypogaea]|uniref:Transposase MuDR plant domain-containing protein n=1 Tax=Arachis hypogaea TaxID=3818 RepID=A0A445D209_ARAHY|nr:hypothetical protein Ahy_A05g022938 [Arachis hypogaea]
MVNRVFWFHLFWLHGDEHVRLMSDIHGRIMTEQVMEFSAEVGDNGGGGSGHSNFVQDDPPVAPPPIRYASPVEDNCTSHYHMLDLDAMHKKTSFSNMSRDDYNINVGVEFRIDHRFKSREALMQGVKNYSICRSAKYRIVESGQLKYHVHCRQFAAGCPWSLHVTL